MKNLSILKSLAQWVNVVMVSNYARSMQAQASKDLTKLKNLILQIGVNPHLQNLGETKLWKLVYFVDVTALRELGHNITGSEFIRYEHGPVPSRGEKSLKQLSRAGDVSIVQEQFPTYRLNRVITATPPAQGVFSDDELELIGRILKITGIKPPSIFPNSATVNRPGITPGIWTSFRPN